MDVRTGRDDALELLEGGGILFPSAPDPAPETLTTEANGAELAPPRAPRRYEELEGQVGRGIFFRPHRYAAADLAPLRGVVTLATPAGDHEAALRDVSQNGAAFTWPRALPVALRQVLRIALRFDGHEAFRGEARVGSIRDQDGATVVGVSFEGFLLDVDEVLQLRDVKAWRPAVLPRREQPWYLPEHSRFSALVAELRTLVEDARRDLDALEATLPWSVLNGPPGAARAALMGRLREGPCGDMIALMAEIDGALRELPGAHANAAARAWSRRQLDDLILTSPAGRRARVKPFGYPGDYEVMNFLYERIFEGPTLFARAMGLTVTGSRGGDAVRCRKDLVKRELRATLAARAGARDPVRVLSIAAGPAQELVELLSELDGELPVPVEVLLFEQDKNALAHAWRRLAPFEAKLRGQLTLTCLHDSVKRLLRDGAMFREFGAFDFAYCCGLFDYFQTRTAVVLARNLYAAVAPGGRLLVANMVDHDGRWLMEFHFEWMLIYRTRAELLELGRRAAPGARLRLLEEASGANPFVELARP